MGSRWPDEKAGQWHIVDAAGPAPGCLGKPLDHRESQTSIWTQLSQGSLPTLREENSRCQQVELEPPVSIWPVTVKPFGERVLGEVEVVG